MTPQQRSWRKSSRSSATDSCVEVSSRLDALRDSKNTSAGLLEADVPTFVDAVRTGLFDDERN